jgi:hypothetical protein
MGGCDECGKVGIRHSVPVNPESINSYAIGRPFLRIVHV